MVIIIIIMVIVYWYCAGVRICVRYILDTGERVVFVVYVFIVR